MRAALSRGRVVRGAAVAFLVAVGAVLTSATPAAAHGLGGLQPTDYQTRVLGMTPRVRGVAVRVVDLGAKLELTNHTGTAVVVLGYDDEPYLRIGPRGTFENLRSPAVYLNRTTRATTPVPASADPHAAPRWHRTGSGTTVRWHDHRAHWMGSGRPPVVDRDPDSTHLVQRWRVELTRAGSTIRVFGDVRWVPGPSPWPWLLGSLAVAGIGLAFAWTRRWAGVLGAVVIVVIAAELVHVLGGWGSSTSSSWSRLAASAYGIGGIAAGVVALVTLVRRGATAAVPLLFIAGTFLLVGSGLADITTLWHSQLPTTLPHALDRLTVAITIGGSTAITGGALLHLLRTPRRPVAAREGPPPTGGVPDALHARYRAPTNRVADHA